MTQTALAEGIGCTQGNVGHYERGQTVPPDAAKRLIAFASANGVQVTYEDIYGPPELIGGESDAGKPELATKPEKVAQ